MQMLLPIAAFFSVLLLLGIFLRTGFLASIKDIPNQRSLHTRPVPRFGGVALMAGVVLGFAALNGQTWPIILPVLLLTAVSFVDDIRGLSPIFRFLIHFLAAGVFAVGMFASDSPLLLLAAIVIAVVWMLNLYNFMDGADGLAGGMTMIGFSVYGLQALVHAEPGLSTLSFCIAASAAAFLFYNFNPARVFMGDVGAVPLGFLAAALGLWGWHENLWQLWFPVLVFSPFVIDASVTLLKRLFRGEKVWEAHKEHYYQQLVQLGWGHKKTAIAEYLLMGAAGLSALWMSSQSAIIQTSVLCIWLLVYLAIALSIERALVSREAQERSA